MLSNRVSLRIVCTIASRLYSQLYMDLFGWHSRTLSSSFRFTRGYYTMPARCSPPGELSHFRPGTAKRPSPWQDPLAGTAPLLAPVYFSDKGNEVHIHRLRTTRSEQGIDLSAVVLSVKSHVG